MRILITVDPEIPVPPKTYGGIERIADQLASGLRQRGHTVGLAAHPSSTAQVDAFFPWSGSQSGRLADTWKNLRTMSGAIGAFEPEVVHSFSRLAYLLPQLRRSTPLIMSYQREPTPRTVAAAAWLARAGTLTFVANSEYIAARGRRAGGVWEVAYNWADLGRLPFQSAVKPDAPLVFLSRVESIKGPDMAIEIARRCGCRLLIAGNHAEEGPEAAYWRDRIVPHLGRDGIDYVGPVDDAQKAELLGQARAMLVPIQWNEPFGIVFAEALACGTPVISCPRGALPEIVRQGREGFLIESIEEGCAAIGRLGDIDRAACRQRAAEAFSLEVGVERFLDLYRQLLDRAR